VRPWLAEADFPIRFIRQQNAGKHISTNRASELAAGELMGVLDADDWYAPNALERFLHHWESIPPSRRAEFAGLVALCADPSGRVLGTPFPEPVLDSDYLEMQFKYRVTGDKAGVARTELHREFKYPELDHGGWVQETIVHNRMARRYKARMFNEVLMFKEYQPTGMSAVGGLARVKSPQSAQLYYRELIDLGSSLPASLLFKFHVNHARFALHARRGLSGSRSGAASPAWWAASAPLGLGLFLRDRLFLRRLAKARHRQ
jgi:glycosyltransferase involved in cell wall biosynthesis